MINNRNKANVQQRENHFKILPDQDVISAKPGQVLYDDAVDRAGLDISHHPFKIRPREICSGPAVINVFIDENNILVLLYIFVSDILLCANAVAFLFITVLS